MEGGGVVRAQPSLNARLHECLQDCPATDEVEHLVSWVQTEYPGTSLALAVYLASIARPDLKGEVLSSRWEDWGWLHEFGDPADPAYKVFWNANELEIGSDMPYADALVEVRVRAPRLWRKLFAKYGAIIAALNLERNAA
jgi:hypothetical protein